MPFSKGDPRTIELGRKGGIEGAKNRPKESYAFAKDRVLAKRAGEVGKDHRYKRTTLHQDNQ